ncbi:extensin-like domain-containing protein [Devosia aurantiaca]|uniref:Extensin family protein n=1 Tax=Devosia aurantiaca TaxID=2714858 RepID=A0A6M1SKD2_9HYPH|nr:extensin family protein [Devosia aurantiaca]NGP16936.1 extensin family protein [Devosia aurantiaca]
MRVLSLPIAALVLAAVPVAAQDFLKPLGDFVEQLAPREQPRPAPRTTPRPPEVAPPAEEPPPLPRPRPEEADAVEEPEEAPEVVAEEPEPEVLEPEPERVYQTACPALLSGIVVGEMLPPIAEGICGERSPLSVTAVRVNGREIGLSSPMTTNCEMAGAFADWVREVDSYATALDNPIETVTTGTSLMCRDRVGGGEAFTSEHGFANALDIVGFTLADGSTVTVEGDWPADGEFAGRLLRQAHGAACGRFTTVLGPEANADHRDHLHLDLGCHGQTCTAQICE